MKKANNLSLSLSFRTENKPAYRLKIEENLVKIQQKAEEEDKKRVEKKRENEKHALHKAMDVSYFTS